MKQPCSLLTATMVLATQSAWAATTTPPPLLSNHAAARILDQATWGPNAASITHLAAIGLPAWLSEQFTAPVSTLPAQDRYDSMGKTITNLGPVQAAFFQNAISNPDQLRQRVAFALSEIWVVSADTVNAAYGWPGFYQIFQDGAFGSYRDLMGAVTLSPMMGRYLNMANNVQGNTAKGTSPNENYGRELMQLFTLGLNNLNDNGTNQGTPTYDNTTVTAVSRALTGWTYPTSTGAMPNSNNGEYDIGQMYPVESNHDKGPKTFFGATLGPNRLAADDLKSTLDTIFNHPTLPPFVCQQLIQHLVTSNPSPAYIQRVVNVFKNNGSGMRGDLKAVVTAILEDSEARAADDGSAVPANFGHLREPVLFVANLVRGLNGSAPTATNNLANLANNIGQRLFYPPSVFSYFSPFSRAEGGLFGPEFQIYSTQTASTRGDYINNAVYGTLDGGTKLDLTPFQPPATDKNYVSDSLNLIAQIFTYGSLSPDLQKAATDAANAGSTLQRKTQAALYIVLTSGEYQIIH